MKGHFYIHLVLFLSDDIMEKMVFKNQLPGPLGQSDARSDWYSGDRGFYPRVRPYIFRRDMVMKSTAIFSILLIQALSVTGKSMGT